MNNLQGILAQLPVEVASDILLEVVLAAPYDRRRVQLLRNLAVVSQPWRDIILSTSRVRAMVSDDMSRSDVDWLLKKSKNAPLDVAFGGGSPCLTFTDYIIPHVSRLRSLRAVADNLLPQLESASLLEEIYVLRQKSLPHLRVELQEGSQLRHVELTNSSLPWDSSRLRGIKTLHIGYVKGDAAPSLPQLLAMIEASPALESLKLEALDIAIGERTNKDGPSGLRSIDLPRLLELDLMRMSSPVCQAIVSSLRFVNCRTLVVLTGRDEGLETTADALAFDNVRMLGVSGERSSRDVAGYLGQHCTNTLGGLDERHWPAPKINSVHVHGSYAGCEMEIFRQGVCNRWQKCEETNGTSSENLVKVNDLRGNVEKWITVAGTQRRGAGVE